MHKHSEATQQYMRSEHGSYMTQVYAEVGERGPITASALSNPGKRSGGWWGWWGWWGSGNGKATMEHLYDAGLLAIAGRRGFERLYDITERVIPQAALNAPAPPREEAMKQLICLAAKAYGVGTFGDITGYFHIDGWRDRMPSGPRWTWAKVRNGRRAQPITRRLVSELVEEKRLLPAQVEGWKEPAYLHPGARSPARRCSRTRHGIRLACLGAQPHGAAFRDEIHDRNVCAAAQTDLRLLRLPVCTW